MDIKDFPKSAIEPIIDDWIINDLYCGRNRNIIKDKMFNGYTHDDLARKYDLTEDQIKNIITKCRKVIAEHLP